MKPPGQATLADITRYYAGRAAQRHSMIRDAGLHPYVHKLRVAEARYAETQRALAISEAAWLKAKADLEALLDEIDQT